LITRVYREIKKITQQRSDPMKKSADDWTELVQRKSPYG
jgi:hypothetical protein